MSTGNNPAVDLAARSIADSAADSAAKFAANATASPNAAHEIISTATAPFTSVPAMLSAAATYSSSAASNRSATDAAFASSEASAPLPTTGAEARLPAAATAASAPTSINAPLARVRATPISTERISTDAPMALLPNANSPTMGGLNASPSVGSSLPEETGPRSLMGAQLAPTAIASSSPPAVGAAPIWVQDPTAGQAPKPATFDSIRRAASSTWTATATAATIASADAHSSHHRSSDRRVDANPMLSAPTVPRATSRFAEATFMGAMHTGAMHSNSNLAAPEAHLPASTMSTTPTLNAAASPSSSSLHSSHDIQPQGLPESLAARHAPVRKAYEVQPHQLSSGTHKLLAVMIAVICLYYRRPLGVCFARLRTFGESIATLIAAIRSRRADATEEELQTLNVSPSSPRSSSAPKRRTSLGRVSTDEEAADGWGDTGWGESGWGDGGWGDEKEKEEKPSAQKSPADGWEVSGNGWGGQDDGDGWEGQDDGDGWEGQDDDDGWEGQDDDDGWEGQDDIEFATTPKSNSGPLVDKV